MPVANRTSVPIWDQFSSSMQSLSHNLCMGRRTLSRLTYTMGYINLFEDALHSTPTRLPFACFSLPQTCLLLLLLYVMVFTTSPMSRPGTLLKFLQLARPPLSSLCPEASGHPRLVDIRTVTTCTTDLYLVACAWFVIQVNRENGRHFIRFAAYSIVSYDMKVFGSLMPSPTTWELIPGSGSDIYGYVVVCICSTIE